MLNELYLFHPHLAMIILAILALLVGSFLNVVIHRLPIMLKLEWENECLAFLKIHQTITKPSEEENKRTSERTTTKSVNLFFPRSFCIRCKTMINIWHNIPVLSYLILKGRCKHCKHPIAIRYPLVEILTMILSVLAAIHFGFSITLVFSLLFIGLTTSLCFIDIEHQLLPDCLTISLLWLGLIANTQSLFTTLPEAVFSAAGAYITLWSVMKLFYLCTGKIGMGHGDFKLFAAFGAWFGWVQLPMILIISSLSGAIIGSIYLKLSGKGRNTPIPFGPFLCLAGLIALFYN